MVVHFLCATVYVVHKRNYCEHFLSSSQMPSPLSWGIGRAATLLKTLLQYYGKSLEALPGVAYPGFRDNCSTLNTKTGYKKKSLQLAMTLVLLWFACLVYNSRPSCIISVQIWQCRRSLVYQTRLICE